MDLPPPPPKTPKVNKIFWLIKANNSLTISSSLFLAFSGVSLFLGEEKMSDVIQRKTAPLKLLRRF